ncbi:hypothetical protein GCM10010156_49160 [Planobispora rosea]|uniref:Uncharacterized protein n=1 Tax=Planobispora rosea TaxID=35762 RepID=A0A8J3S5R8_PLARO|nr:hypothetical protein [Planobispora rosea]GGS84687.1 hypothetical protein GCM10010156_49160 [Planobispora rosea]GIH86427.1 hypothetical protein Pro02_48350 [Planobispora rosea]
MTFRPPPAREQCITALSQLAALLQTCPDLPAPACIIVTLPCRSVVDAVAATLEERGLGYLDYPTASGRAITVYREGGFAIRWQSPPDHRLIADAVAPAACTDGPGNCPPAPPFDGAGLFWDNCDNYAITTSVEADGSGLSSKDLHCCSEFGDVTGASVLIAISKGGRWQWQCIGCRKEITSFGHCDPCAQNDSWLSTPPPPQ